MEIAGYAASVLVGLSLGLIGGGGSILTVPILVYFFGIDPVLASAYSLFVVGLTSAAGSVSYYRNENVEPGIAIIFGLPSLTAVFSMRKWVMPAIPQHILTIGRFSLTKSEMLMLAFAVLMLAAAFSMVRRSSADRDRALPRQFAYPRLILQGTLVGIITGFVGVGGGFLIIPSLMLFAGLSMKKAVGTSLTVMALSSLLGVIADISRPNHIDYPFLLRFAAFALAGILAGSHLSNYIPDKRLKPAFGWFVLLMGLFVLFNTLIN